MTRVLGLGAAYFITGKLGLLLAIPPGYATAIWPPSGIALAGLLLFGYRLWPGVLLGSFAVNIGVGFDASSPATILHSVLIALGIAAGASCQAAAGTYLIHRFVGYPNALTAPRQVIVFLLLAGPVSCIINPTVGSTIVLFTDGLTFTSYLEHWLTWWAGDVLGVVVVVPIVFAFMAAPREVWARRKITVALPLGALFTAAVLLFVYISTLEQRRFQSSVELAWIVLVASLLVIGLLGTFLLVVTGRVESKISASVESQRRAEEQKRQKEVLLQEIHHRVKNNLQVISSLLTLQKRQVDSPELQQILEECKGRVLTIALVHDKLHGSQNFTVIPMDEYVHSLVRAIASTFHDRSKEVSVQVETQPLGLDVERAVPCGLILHELLTNALKYAFPSHASGALQVAFKAAGQGRASLVVKDNGVGLPAHIDIKQPGTLGLELVATLAAQIKADLEVERHGGTAYRLTFDV